MPKNALRDIADCERKDMAHFKNEELESVGEMSKVCSQIVLKCLYVARIGRPDILWSANKLRRAVTKMDSGM